MPTLLQPSLFSPEIYRTSILNARNQIETTSYTVVLSPDKRYCLTAGTGGWIKVYDMDIVKGSSSVLDADAMVDDDAVVEERTKKAKLSDFTGSAELPTYKATCKFRLPEDNAKKSDDTIVIYSLHISTPYLYISGTHGCYMIDYATLSSSFPSEPSESDTKTLDISSFVKVVKTFHPHPSSSETSPIEVNDVATSSKKLYLAAGDNFGVYEFDIGTGRLVREMGHVKVQGGGKGGKSGSIGYLHTVSVLEEGNYVVSGGEGGCVQVQDTRQKGNEGWRKNIAEDIRKRDKEDSRKGGWTSDLDNSASGDFVIATGGYEGDGGGFVCNLHLGSRSVVGSVLTERVNNCAVFMEESGNYLVGDRGGVVTEYGAGGLGKVGVRTMDGETWGVGEGDKGIVVGAGWNDSVFVDWGKNGVLERV